jgi:glycosyltransferase involved in cell wall biosynthesis
VPSAPMVTVLTCVRNGARFLAETIDSISSQTFEDWEYILVDDASDDETADVIERFSAQDARIRSLRRRDPGGPYVAANDGVGEARGKYVMRIDADDLALPERMAIQLSILEKTSELRACLGGWQLIDDRGGPVGDLRRTSASPRMLRWSLCVVSGFVHSTAFFERDALEAVGGYAPYPASADLKLWCDLARRGWLGVTEDVVTLYRRHDRQITSTMSGRQHEIAWTILQEHLAELTNEAWSIDDVRALFAPGRWGSTSFSLGSDMLTRWERAWRRDATLTPVDRRALRSLTRRIRLRHIRMNRRSFIDGFRGAIDLLPHGRFR